jgi:peptidoglycan hydrolase FlgJ
MFDPGFLTPMLQDWQRGITELFTAVGQDAGNPVQFERFAMTPVLPPAAMPPQQRTFPAQDEALMKAARELEASFLAEMLKSAGLGETPEAFGGGTGEDQFASFLRLEQARAMVEAGGIGLAESLFEALKERAVGPV